jgi:hypothetical protein
LCGGCGGFRGTQLVAQRRGAGLGVRRPVRAFQVHCELRPELGKLGGRSFGVPGGVDATGRRCFDGD